MNKMKLFEAIDLIDDDLIREAEISSETSTKRSTEDESAITVSGVEVRSGIRWQRIAALASAFILIAGFGGIGALLHKHRPTRHIEPSEVVIPPATESTTAAEDKQTESTEAATKKEKDKEKETKESTNTAPTTNANEEKKPAVVDSQSATDEKKSTVSEKGTFPQTTTKITTKKASTSTVTTVAETKTNTSKSEIFARLANLNYIPITCDGLPEYKLTTDDGQIYWINLHGKYIWKNGIDAEAVLPDDIINWLTENINSINMQPTRYYQEEETPDTTEPWVIHLPCTKASNVTWRSYQCPEMFEILRSIQYRQITAAEFAVTEYEAPNTYLIDSNDNNRVYALNFEHKWVMRYGTDGTDCGDAPMPDRLYELFCGS
ncbi:hypothetical protein [Ruminococcus flavefaciens]|uniref:hypothetical protein n=1 Tax=Ruminococcus flavefaciens TaxID=1265 RepID=UPI0004908239|nr:hypothetical protein [Ruminococcus flavefaciens]